MSESKNNETPKRKRRTKEEIEAAKAAGTYKPRTKKVKELKPNGQAPEEYAAKVPLKPEQRVLIMSCLNPTVAQGVTEIAKQNGVEVVVLEDKVLYDYLDAKGEVASKENLGNFLFDTTNRLQSERNAVALWQILTGGAPIEQADGRAFSRTQVVKMTNLTHSKAQDALNSLQMFGLLEYVKGTHEFRFIFDKKRSQLTIRTEVLAMCKQLNLDIVRYKAAIESDDNLTKDEKRKLYEELQDSINSTIEF